MKTRSWLLLLIFSVIGYSATFYFFPKVMPAAHWGTTLDRAAAIVKAKSLAESFGIEKSDWTGWIELVETTYGRQNEYYLATQSMGLGGVGVGLLSAISTQVTLNDPRTHRKIKVNFRADGFPQEFKDRLPKENNSKTKIETSPGNAEKSASPTTPAAMPEPERVSDADKQLAENAFKSFWGERLLAAATLAESNNTQQGARLVWKAEDQKLKLTARVLVRDGKIKELSLDHDFTKSFDAEFKVRRSTFTEVLSSADFLVVIPSILLVMIFYFLGLALKRIQQRQGLVFLVAASLLILLIILLGRMGDDLRNGTVSGTTGYWVTVLLPWLLVLVVTLAIAGSLYFFWVAGQSLEIRLPHRRTISFELLLKGQIFTKPVAQSIAAGLMAGGIFISIPILAAASHLFSGLELDAHGLENTFAAHFPAFPVFFAPLQYLLFIVFAFFAPMICVYVKRLLLARILILVTCTICLIGTSFVYISATGMLVTGVLMGLALTALYFRGDLLAIVFSLFGVHAAIGAAALLAQPSVSLQSSGWRAIAGLAVLLVVSLIGVWRFREVTEEETAIPAHLLETRIERERLKADFNVAQRAQQQMLPDAPPQIPGLEIAAICKPSKEVGGDLYDFLPLRDGKLGIVVADVSGKGVPASLYMTLTKGLLTSIAETVDDPGEILREVNRHLYEVCRRKMFVTLFLGVIDPVTKRMVYARAGHNPTVFRSVARQETSLLKPKGMGLGLNSGKIFDQSLKVETLQLELNDKLFFYSDGITEAMNPKNEEYGEERLIEIAEKADDLAASEARDAVMTDVTRFLASNQPQDDQTLVVVKVI